MCTYYPKSKVEIKGFTAKNYDWLINIMSFGRYPSVIYKAIQLMNIKPTDKILDLGAGTGRNDCLMAKYLSKKGEIIGLDIYQEMSAQFQKNCIKYSNVKIINKRIDKPLNYKNHFDKVFISFVIHGFPQKIREQIIKNAFESLKKGGKFFILDFNKFSLKKMPFYFKIPFKIIECPYAFDFIKRNFKKDLSLKGFNKFKTNTFFKGYIRLIEAKK